MRDAGLADVSLTPTHLVTDGMHSVIARATKPESVAALSINRRAADGIGRLWVRLRRLLLGNPGKSRDRRRCRGHDDHHQDRGAQPQGDRRDPHADEPRIGDERWPEPKVFVATNAASSAGASRATTYWSRSGRGGRQAAPDRLP